MNENESEYQSLIDLKLTNDTLRNQLDIFLEKIDVLDLHISKDRVDVEECQKQINDLFKDYNSLYYNDPIYSIGNNLLKFNQRLILGTLDEKKRWIEFIAKILGYFEDYKSNVEESILDVARKILIIYADEMKKNNPRQWKQATINKFMNIIGKEKTKEIMKKIE